ncbi:QacE family quaternary ammonium compound efflux SMR transporter [Pseudolysinimonas yzui]|uniref:QacE family quaternary ammonium compound efflux SMR transporter n=1 Tax=Pseudolysinimonas yzui TaxID=2708254 RepID=A0A8J3GQL4_9MICO|nr:QacE family quaternary ammonium compound efflux SMR transporter [Pseudolysinimonas yzui]
MIAWLFLVVAILTEVTATLALQAAVKGSRWWYLLVATGYVVAFTMLSLSLGEGMPLGVAYGIWTAAGVAFTAVLGKVIFKQPFTWMMALGVALIAGGVLLIEVGAH